MYLEQKKGTYNNEFPLWLFIRKLNIFAYVNDTKHYLEQKQAQRL